MGCCKCTLWFGGIPLHHERMFVLCFVPIVPAKALSISRLPVQSKDVGADNEAAWNIAELAAANGMLLLYCFCSFCLPCVHCTLSEALLHAKTRRCQSFLDLLHQLPRDVMNGSKNLRLHEARKAQPMLSPNSDITTA